MRKKNYLLGAIILGLGVLVGTLVMALTMNSGSPTSFISKLRGENNIQPVSGVAQTPPSPNPVKDVLSENDPANDFEENELSGSEKDHHSIQDGESPLALQVVADYKQNIGLFFGAWKSNDMVTFREKLAKAYAGDIFEKHARRAEEYLVQGIGLDVSEINFDQVDVESIGEKTATLRVEYHYTARDFDLIQGVAVGEPHEQFVQVRVNLIKQNSRWVITGESSVQ